MSNISQRDAFWNRVYERAQTDRNIIVVSADMGAPALDEFRRDLSAQFVNAGIAEQNAIVVSTGLALTGKKVFVYAIAPFITLRCLEQIRVNSAIMKIPITIVGVGAGFGYDDSGPTHHIIEDIAVMRALPNIIINSISDSVMASAFADISLTMHSTNYVRLDRLVSPDLYDRGTDFSKGLSILKQGKDCYIVCTGSIAHAALRVADQLEKDGTSVGVIDVYTIPIDSSAFMQAIQAVDKLVTLEEHFLPGGFGSTICEILQDSGVLIPVRRMGLSPAKGYCYKYGGRDIIRAYYGLDVTTIEKTIIKFMETTSYEDTDYRRSRVSRGHDGPCVTEQRT